jgi:hypothetical protein
MSADSGEYFDIPKTLHLASVRPIEEGESKESDSGDSNDFSARMSRICRSDY